MEVTRSNFSSVLSDMLEAVSTATFVSFDGEFTGLSAGGNTIAALDSPKMRYFKLKQNQAVDFMLLQVRGWFFLSPKPKFEVRPHKTTVHSVDKVVSRRNEKQQLNLIIKKKKV